MKTISPHSFFQGRLNIFGRSKGGEWFQFFHSLSAALMLRYSFGLEEAAASIENAVKGAIRDGFRTIDVAQDTPSIGTREMGQAILERLD